ncbi:hypothetical protein EGW08_000010 [Elysia chlorotica]|uniref:Uncharacterized protein n=1 Tax=Elysia chlorotica TaxID=188477 RepID=A0A433UE70_ELYCH|nr:hypothetical protein EGW08_000010 [Elysia chlorotica]
MPPVRKSCPSGTKLTVATLFWILSYLVSLGLAVASLITECWIRWKEEVTQSNHCYGIFLSGTSTDRKPCELEAVVRETGKELFKDFDLHSMVALMILGIGFDTLTVSTGLLYFFAKGKAKTSLWKRSIPTLTLGLISAGMVFLAFLIFIDDLEKVTDSQVNAFVDERCTTRLDEVNLLPSTGFSVYLALAAGTTVLLKTGTFGCLAACC